jgi:hypothetical protein
MSEDQAGWGKVLRKVLTQLHTPWKALSWSRSVTSGEGSPLLTVRLAFVSFLTALAGYGLVLSFVTKTGVRRSPALFVSMSVVAGIAGLALVGWARSRPLASSSPDVLVKSFTTTLFIGIGFAELPALLGFVGALASRRFWVYLVGLAFSLVGFALTAPTDGAIRRRDEQLMASGSPYLLSDALRQPPSVSTPPR